MKVSGDWLNGDVRDSATQEEARDHQRLKDVERAQLYRAAFADNVAGKLLLASWDQDIANLRVDVNATLSQHVAAEAVRNFVRKVHEQIRLAQTEGKT